MSMCDLFYSFIFLVESLSANVFKNKYVLSAVTSVAASYSSINAAANKIDH